MTRHDEPNEYGFAGDPTGPEAPPKGKRDEIDAAEEVAVPGGDVTSELSDALSGGREREADGEAARTGPAEQADGRDRGE